MPLMRRQRLVSRLFILFSWTWTLPVQICKCIIYGTVSTVAQNAFNTAWGHDTAMKSVPSNDFKSCCQLPRNNATVQHQCSTILGSQRGKHMVNSQEVMSQINVSWTNPDTLSFQINDWWPCEVNHLEYRLNTRKFKVLALVISWLIQRHQQLWSNLSHVNITLESFNLWPRFDQRPHHAAFSGWNYTTWVLPSTIM